MSESKEKHRLRMQLKRSHPEWSGEKLKEEHGEAQKSDVMRASLTFGRR